MNETARKASWMAATAALVLGGVAGCSDSDEESTTTAEGPTEETQGATPDRIIEFESVDFGYETLDLSGIEAGETIRFVMENAGTEPHEFEVLGPDGEALGEVEKTAVGEVGEAVITFEEPGPHTYQCILSSEQHGEAHDALGMTGSFEVAAT